jgi:hypothetical protein
MSSEHYETIDKNDERRAVVSLGGALILTRWHADQIPDGFYFRIQGARHEHMLAIADAINAAIDAREEARND